ncbi:MAG: 1-phosphofructokinase family hexose kinase [Planctomycetes bacterium]|nr:1-phosphofructokinase family hexose kinase [Planctomycetota bacterium]
MIVTVTCNPTYDKTLEVPGFAAGLTLRARTIRRQPAGKGVNVARCMATLGCPATATGFLGDAEADAYARSFQGTGVIVDFVGVPRATRQNTTILDPDNNTHTHIREEGFAVDANDLAALQQKLTGLIKQGDLVIFAGSLPPGMEPHHLAGLVELCKAAGCYVAVDTSGPALSAAVDAGCSIAKPNLEELEQLEGKNILNQDAIVRAARRLACRVRILLVTLGADGAWCFTGNGAWRARLQVEGAGNTVGAGDAFLAGFAAGYVNGAPLDACLRQAVACGSASTLQQWAGEIDPADVKRLGKKVKITEFEFSQDTASP